MYRQSRGTTPSKHHRRSIQRRNRHHNRNRRQRAQNRDNNRNNDNQDQEQQNALTMNIIKWLGNAASMIGTSALMTYVVLSGSPENSDECVIKNYAPWFIFVGTLIVLNFTGTKVSNLSLHEDLVCIVIGAVLTEAVLKSYGHQPCEIGNLAKWTFQSAQTFFESTPVAEDIADKDSPVNSIENDGVELKSS